MPTVDLNRTREPPFCGPDGDCLDVGSSTQNMSICVPINAGETGADLTVVPMSGRPH
jgi:hypothetical protein